MADNTLIRRIHWLGHDSMRINSHPVIYFDPYDIQPGVEAGIILITHEHYDHCSVEDVKKVLGNETVIVTEKDSAEKLSKAFGKALEGRIETMEPGESMTVKGVTIEAVRSYNINKKFHPKNKNWLGFVVDVEGTRVYHAGDTDLIPEMADIRCDVALLPVSGTYVMTAQEAVDAAVVIKPAVAVPMHYGALVGDEGDAENFEKGLEGKVHVEIFQKES